MLNLNSVTARDSLAAQVKAQDNSFAFDINAFTLQCEARADVESFIKQGFKKSYDANIEVTMPFLLAINNGKLKAALGIRNAKSTLFVEQYLPCPIEQHHAFNQQVIKRQQIAEIGHLYSNARRFTIPLFLVMAVSLFFLDFKYVIFSGTERVLSIISRAGIDISYLAAADPSKLTESDNDWGRYYETKPQVVLISLASVISVIESQPAYEKLFKQLQQKIVKVSGQLQGLK